MRVYVILIIYLVVVLVQKLNLLDALFFINLNVHLLINL